MGSVVAPIQPQILIKRSNNFTLFDAVKTSSLYFDIKRTAVVFQGVLLCGQPRAHHAIFYYH